MVRESDRIACNVDIIIVPSGAEYRAVCQGLKGIDAPKPLVLAIPIGVTASNARIKKWQQSKDFPNKTCDRILLMGLCGSLSPKYRIGDTVIYQSCGYGMDELSWQECDRDFNALLYDRLQDKASLVKGWTSDRVICSAQEKISMGRTYHADVVDMEGYAVLKNCDRVSIVRVVSDDCQQDLPDLTLAISSDGKLKSIPLAIAMGKNPLAAVRLVRGSLKGLRVLQRVTSQLFSR